MQQQRPQTQPALDNAGRLRVGELTQVGTTLTDEEMKAVAGARMTVSWTCGSAGRADEWNVSPN